MIGRFLDDGDLRKLHRMLLKKPPAPSAAQSGQAMIRRKGTITRSGLERPEGIGPLSLQNREMPAPPRKRPLGVQQRRALQLLASIPFGATKAATSLNGFERQTLVRLIRGGLATTHAILRLAGKLSAASGSGRRALEGY
jgi:hypothetical protein